MAGSRNLELRTRKVFVVVIDIARNRAACVAAVFVICQERANIVNSSNVERGLVSSPTRAHTHTHTHAQCTLNGIKVPRAIRIHTHTHPRARPQICWSCLSHVLLLSPLVPLPPLSLIIMPVFKTVPPVAPPRQTPERFSAQDSIHLQQTKTAKIES